ncbi:thiol:disulfide interchange protein DsbA/DsbL [Pelomonas sp. CA6]|uniref:thiol:disulfide interchange protein DsbA/DsbL n=1 Tax=Pelomonas sp. CA6 TaxID=2907999 RepID=UPI001F4BEFFD|nr:thiol:disulfide interchange protein DsbA/DsbL [Pelomonas sp. CA6]MCH7343530.1 thiol:disulfide interchange protein DsbA/DsbL [Pelomonas sp. CA6]
MKRREFNALACAAGAAGLAGVSGNALAQAELTEGRNYRRVNPPLPPAAPGKIEVVEFFWYGCPHCYVFEPAVEAWAQRLPADVSFRKVHVAFRENVKVHQRLFYTLEAMGKEAETRPAIFNAIHRGGNMLDNPKGMAEFLSKLGVDPAKFTETYNSFGVNTKCLQAAKLQDAYGIDGVPAIGVAGRFLTSPSMAAAGQRMSEQELGARALAVTDALIRNARGR